MGVFNILYTVKFIAFLRKLLNDLAKGYASCKTTRKAFASILIDSIQLGYDCIHKCCLKVLCESNFCRKKTREANHHIVGL